MHYKYTEIDLDKSVKVRFKVITKNSLTLYFKFTDKDGNILDATNMSFVFVVTDKSKTVEVFKVNNNDWVRDSVNEIKHTTNMLNVEPNEYLVDFTCTYADGRVQTLMDGEFNVRERNTI